MNSSDAETVFIPLGPPYPPFYPWCRHLLNPRWIQPFRAPDLYCLHPPTGKSKRFRLKQMSSCPRGWPGSGPHFLPRPQPPGLGNSGLGPLQPCLSLSQTPTRLPAAQQRPAGLCRKGKAYIRLTSCRLAASGELEMSGLNNPTRQQLFLPLGLRRGRRGEGQEALESPEPALPGGSVGAGYQ